ncbi:MAG: hypothetical protein ACFFCP_09490, partial [Promethearchaeota archaeon]
VKTKDISLGLGKSDITVREASNAAEILHWPIVTIKNPDRRQTIYNATKTALETADKMEAKRVGFFTTGLEIARVPSWEVAEEIIKAVHSHSMKETQLIKVLLVASSPIQLSSFRFVLENIATIIPDTRTSEGSIS